MIIEEDIYLEHFGVKGMRWGVRRSQGHPDVGNRKRTKTKKQKRKRNQKIAKTAARIAIGGIFAAAFLAQFGAHKAPPRMKFNAPQSVKDIINAERDTQISSLTRMHKEGHMDSDQFKTFLSALNKRYDRKLVDAM